MAKMRNMNIFEAHLEKVLLVLALGVLVWVVYDRVITPPGIAISGDTLKPSEVAKKGAELARRAVENIKELDRDIPSDYEKKASTLFVQVKPLEVVEVPLFPPFNLEFEPEEIRQYRMPDNIPSLTDVGINLTHTQAWVPKDSKETSLVRGQEYDIKDVDFVTVEAVFPITQVYDLFEKSFSSSAVETPLEQFGESIVALVELQKQQLLPDGSWSEYKVVPQLKVDNNVQIERTYEQIQQLTRAAYKVELQERQNYQRQLSLLQPLAFQLVEGKWLSPIDKKEASKSPDTLRNTRGRRPPSRSRSRVPSPVRDIGMIGSGILEMEQGAGYPGGTPGPFTGRSRSLDAGVNQQKPYQFTQEELTLWSHDPSVEAGRIYRYRIRLGFFNPIADTNWFSEDQEHLKNQRVLWSDYAYPEKIVKVPVRTVFFPKSTQTRSKGKSIGVIVCRYQEGKWYKKSFNVTPGSTIGTVHKEKIISSNRVARADSKEVGYIEVDYRTGITAIDIIPNGRHWLSNKANMIEEVVCSDIIYRDRDGTVKRMGIHKKCWPRELPKLLTTINKKIKEQKEARRTTR